MRAAYVLYIADDIVGPCLNLIRSLCNPESVSMPHITVRYPIDRLQDNDLTAYQNLTIDKIDVIGPGAFGMQDNAPRGNRTVFVECNSDVLEALSYKPDYPDSIFHITLYDGASAEFAKQLLGVLQGFPWGFTVPLPKPTKLTRIETARHRRHSTSQSRTYSHELKSLFHHITSQRLSTALVTGLTDAERLGFARAICAHLHNTTANFPKATSRSPSATREYPQAPLKADEQGLGSRSLGATGTLAFDHEVLTKSQSLFLTPPELARDIVTYAVSKLAPANSTVDFGDPAVGTGVFFSALLRVLPQNRINSAIGIDIDFKRAEETRKRWSHRGLEVERGDYLHMDRLPPRTLILANPPYARYQDVPLCYRQKLQERASVQIEMRISGQSSLYVYFLILSHGWMKRGAVAAWLIPSEFMETNYGIAVRRYLTERVELIRIHRFSPDRVQFENALVSSAVVVYRNCTPKRDQTVILSTGESLPNPKHTEEVPLSDLLGENKWKVPWIRRSRSSSLRPRIGDLFAVHRGLATGANSFFIVKRPEAIRLGIPEVATRPILPKARFLEADVIEREQDGYPRVSPQLCLIDCALSEEEIGITYPRFLAYLKAAPQAVSDSALVRRRHPWYRQEQRRPSPFLFTYMGRGSKSIAPLRFLWNRSDAVAANTYLMLYPRETLGRWLNDQPDGFEKVFALLRATDSQDIFLNDRVYAGGLHKIEPRELRNVRLSSCPSWVEHAVDMRLPLE